MSATADNSGRAASPNRLSSPTEPQERLGPSGFDPARGPWLIWSEYHDCWHRRCEDEDGEEHAAGYTDDILQAGIFGEAIARAYNDDRDTPIPIAAVAGTVRARVTVLERELATAHRFLLFARDSDSGPQGENSRSEVEGEAPQSGGSEASASPETTGDSTGANEIRREGE